MGDLFKDKYRIPSARAAWHGYNGGIYFVTLCAAGHEHYFGEIEETAYNQGTIEPQMQLSEIGHIAVENLQSVSQHYPYAEIPLFVVMPNHVHAIVEIIGDNGGVAGVREEDVDNVGDRDVDNIGEGDIDNIGEGDVDNIGEGDVDNIREGDVARYVSTGKNAAMSNIAPRRGSLPVVVRGIKSAVARAAKERGISFAWQARYHDRIIRNLNEMNCIAEYIENNIAKWHEDELNERNAASIVET